MISSWNPLEVYEMPDQRATERRQVIQDQARAMGIDDNFIDLLVETFYARIRENPVLGPVFNNAIGDNWDYHLARMKDFWASVTMNAGRYSGKPVPAHRQHLNAIHDWHFGVWLGLFQQTLEDIAPTIEAVDYFMERAERIASSLKLALYGMPGLGAPSYE